MKEGWRACRFSDGYLLSSLREPGCRSTIAGSENAGQW